jgi:hypothetical protein
LTLSASVQLGLRANFAVSCRGAPEFFSSLLEGLVERVANDSGAAFSPDVVEALAALKSNDRAAYESLRTKLKKAKCRVTALDEVVGMQSGRMRDRPTQAEILIELAEDAELFHIADKTAFADLEVNGHRETWPIRGKTFHGWLGRRYFEETEGGAPNSEAFQSALNVIEAQAQFSGPEREVHVRIGSEPGRLHVDLCNEAWQAVEVDESGWRVVDRPPIRFRRTRGMKSLPIPVSGGSVQALRDLVNVRSDADFVLAISWILAAYRDKGPYPIMAVSGEQGSAKSTISRLLRELVDPNITPLRTLARDERDMFISAGNAHVLAFDNLSHLSDAATRQLYSDMDEMLFEAEQPIILNGIDDVIVRPDLADRAVFLRLDPISDQLRRSERELWAAFEAAAPGIIGALLDAVSTGLAMLPSIHLPTSPRMADFALWVTACESALWSPGTFLNAYNSNRADAVGDVIEADAVAAAVFTLMEKHDTWSGTATALQGALAEIVGDAARKIREWPRNPKGLSGRLRRAATNLRRAGIDVTFTKEGHTRTRTISIKRVPAFSVAEIPRLEASASSALSSCPRKTAGSGGFPPAVLRTLPVSADDWIAEQSSIVRTNRLQMHH